MAGLDLGTVEGLENVAIPLPSAGGLNKDGLQEAHIFGTKFWSDDLGSLLDIIDPNRNLLTVDMKANGFLAPESSAGSMALGTSVHKGEQQEAYDALAYDKLNADTSDQYLVTVTVHLIKRANKYEIQIVVRIVILC